MMNQRTELSHRFIEGSGIEIGGLHCPLEVKEGVAVTYVDLANAEQLQETFKEVSVKSNTIIVDSAETLSLFADESQDFVIANHVFEHCEDPIYTWENWLRVLKSRGIIYAAIPDKRFTFDKRRASTSFSHLLKDYIRGPNCSLLPHYVDWYSNSELELAKSPELEQKIEAAMKSRQNIHFHVWDFFDIVQMIHSFTDYFDFKPLEIVQNGMEVIVIAQKI